VYRLWRDGGFAVGALLAGVIADAYGILAAIWAVAALTAASGLVVAVRMYETRPPHQAGKGSPSGRAARSLTRTGQVAPRDGPQRAIPENHPRHRSPGRRPAAAVSPPPGGADDPHRTS